MMMNMFWIFDPLIYSIPFNWMFSIMILFLIKNKFWKINKSILNYFNKLINKEIYNNNQIMNKSLINLFLSLMNLLLIMNLMNLLPNMFYLTSNLNMTLNLSFFFINMFLFFNLFNNKNIFFMNLTPKNTPMMLIFFINLIELNSFFIQIITLAMRLMINMILGHMITSLMNNYFSIFIYLIMEFLIIIIQTYVFYILNLLNSNNMY